MQRQTMADLIHIKEGVDSVFSFNQFVGPFGLRIVVLNENYPYCMTVGFRPAHEAGEVPTPWNIYHCQNALVQHPTN